MGAALGGFMPCFGRWWRSSSQIFTVHEHNIPARSAKVFSAAGFAG
jgi:hypothetical protein